MTVFCYYYYYYFIFLSLLFRHVGSCTPSSEDNTIQLYCLYVEKVAFWLVIYIKTFNTVNNKTSTLTTIFRWRVDAVSQGANYHG